MEDYLFQENAVKSVAGVWHSLSICAVCPMGHNSNSSQAQFDGGENVLVMLSCQRLQRGGQLGPYPQAWILVDLRTMLWTSPLLMTMRTCFPLTLKYQTLSFFGGVTSSLLMDMGGWLSVLMLGALVTGGGCGLGRGHGRDFSGGVAHPLLFLICCLC